MHQLAAGAPIGTRWLPCQKPRLWASSSRSPHVGAVPEGLAWRRNFKVSSDCSNCSQMVITPVRATRRVLAYRQTGSRGWRHSSILPCSRWAHPLNPRWVEGTREQQKPCRARVPKRLDSRASGDGNCVANPRAWSCARTRSVAALSPPGKLVVVVLNRSRSLLPCCPVCATPPPPVERCSRGADGTPQQLPPPGLFVAPTAPSSGRASAQAVRCSHGRCRSGPAGASAVGPRR